MADGDPMVLQTIWGDPEESLCPNGTFDKYTYINAKPDGWSGGTSMTHSRQSGARTDGSGTYYWKATRAGAISGNQVNLGYVTNHVVLSGNDGLDARGHFDQDIYVSIWAKQDGTDAPSIWPVISEYDKDGAYLGGVLGASKQVVTSGWTQLVWGPLAFDSEETAEWYFGWNVQSNSDGDTSLYVDDCLLYLSYTFAANPSMPDDQDIIEPARRYGRSSGATLYMVRGAASATKFQKNLNFGLIGLDQLKALRSLYLLGKPMRWTPNQPHLPSSLDVMMTKYKFGAGRGAFGANIYRGSIELSER